EKREYKPLDTEIDFLDTKRVGSSSHITNIDTPWALLSFSTDGGSLESIDFKRELSGAIKTIRTSFPVAETQRENRFFLIALDEKTPFYYSLESFSDNDSSYQLVYKAENDECSIIKTFTVNKNSSKIDLLLDIEPKKGKQALLTPRIFFPAPLMPDIRGNDIVSSIVIDQTDVFAKKRVDQLDVKDR